LEFHYLSFTLYHCTRVHFDQGTSHCLEELLPLLSIHCWVSLQTSPQALSQLSHTDQGIIRNTALFGASRTLFAISQIYGNNFMKNTLGKTNAGHTPIAAILCCSTFGLLAFLGLADRTYNQVSMPISKQHALKGLLERFN
jgi:amino acid transporter